jgi:hypothetical protein
MWRKSLLAEEFGGVTHTDINQFIYGRFQSNQETNIFVLASYLSIQA